MTMRSAALAAMYLSSAIKWAVQPGVVMGLTESLAFAHSFPKRRRSCLSSSVIESDHHISISSSVEARMYDLITHPAITWDTNSTFTSMHKKKLARRHLPLFDRPENINHDALFDDFATAVCHAGVVARKEVFETWASALYIHNHFFRQMSSCDKPLRRVADIAAGHGLLAWALLILDDEYRKQESELQPLTAFCLDVQMPKSAELIQASMLEKFPHLTEQFDYVEGRLEQLIPHKSCLLAGVHACGTLSDVLVSTAAESGVSLALVPCCHSRKAKVLQACASRFAKEEYDAILNTKGKIPDLANLLDSARIAALKNSGMDVQEASIPNLFTDKNRLIMATSGSNNVASAPTAARRMKSGQMPPLNAFKDDISSTMINSKARFMKGFYVPCKDDNESRSFVSEISGRLAAERRKVVMHNRNHQEMPQLDISLWLPNDGSDITEEEMSQLITSKNTEVNCSVARLGEVYTDPKTGRRAQTFRIQYGSDKRVMSFEEANQAHKLLYTSIPLAFPGAECR